MILFFWPSTVLMQLFCKVRSFVCLSLEMDLHKIEVKKKSLYIFATQGHVNSAGISLMMDCKH